MSINLWLSPRLRNEPLSEHCDYNWMESSNMSQMLNSDKCEQLSTIGLVLNIGPSKAGSRVMKALQSARRFYSIQNLFEVRVASNITSVIMIRNDGSKNSWMWGTGGLSLERGSK